MAIKYIDIMDTTFKDGFQSIFDGRVLTDDFLPAIEFAKNIGISHFEFGGIDRFQSHFYLQENVFEVMHKIREVVGAEVNLQILSSGISTVTHESSSREMIDLFAKLFAKYETTTVRNYDALNDIRNLEFSGAMVKKYGMEHEIAITMMDLPHGCKGAHSVEFYKNKLLEILDSPIEFDSIVFKDASGTSTPVKIYETIKMARELLGDEMHIRLHTHESAGVSISCYLAAMEAGVNGIDLAVAPASGGISQPDMLTLLHATKGMNYNIGDLDIKKVIEYERFLKNQLNDYTISNNATKVEPLIQFAPMPGNTLIKNIQTMKNSGNLKYLNKVVDAMSEVIEKGGYGTSIAPISQYYWQQAYINVIFGQWKKIAPGYGKMILGYFGRTPIAPDPEIVELASKELKLKPTTKDPLDIADTDEKKSIKYWNKILIDENIELTDENIFIVASCNKKGIELLKGEGQLSINKKNSIQNKKKLEKIKDKIESYIVTVDGKRFSVQVKQNSNDIKSITTLKEDTKTNIHKIYSHTDGLVWKILKNKGDSVRKNETIMILDTMKMEIDVVSPVNGIIETINVNTNDNILNNQLLVTIKLSK